MNQLQLDTLFLVYILKVNASTCFGRYSRIFRGLCTEAIWCNCVRRMCVVCVPVVVVPDRHVDAGNTHTTHTITPNSICAETSEYGRVTPETSRGIDS
jgi:hypothetical protein